MKAIDVVILCGGQGSRLREAVSDRPKPMAEIHGRPFLDILISHVSSFGLRRFILCTGYMADSIERYYGDTHNQLTMLFSREALPRGTGGALKNAERLIKSGTFLVMNGDSFCRADIDAFRNFHLKNNALLSMVVSASDESGDFGSLAVDDGGRITGFREKAPSRRSLINAGIYLMETQILSLIPPNCHYSLEKELFPRLVGKDFFGFQTEEEVIDIGTPERLESARRALPL